MHVPLTQDLPENRVALSDNTLPSHLLTKVFPFYLTISKEMRVVQVGDAMQRLYPRLVSGELISNHFGITFPQIPFDFNAICDNSVFLFLLEHKENNLQFKGRMIALEAQEMLLFLGSPWVVDSTTLTTLGVKLRDCAVQASIPDILFLLQARSASLSQTVQLATILAEQRLELQQAMSQAKLTRAVLDQAVDAIEITDDQLKILYVNQAFEQITGFLKEEAIGKTPAALFYAGQHKPEFYEEIWQVISAGKVWQGALIGKRKDRSFYYQEATIFPVFDQAGVITNYVAIRRDVSDRKQTQTRLEHSVALLQATFEATADGILVTDIRGKITNFNQKFIDLWQIPEDILATRDHQQVMECIKTCLKNSKEFSAKKLLKLYVRPHSETVDLLELKDGRMLERYASPQRLDDMVIGWVWSFRDVTERQRNEARIRYQAMYDALTELPNRTLFNDRLSISLIQASRNRAPLAVMFLDLDRFKQINDTLGHAAGDLLLQGVAERISSCLRKGDTVARWAGDEFTLLLPNVHTVQNAANIAQRILESLRTEFDLNGHRQCISSSIGIAFYPQHGEDGDTLLKNADVALYQAKENGRDNYQIYSFGQEA